MAEGGLKLLDGSQIAQGLPTVIEKAEQRFQDLDTEGCGISTDQFLAAARSDVSALLFGITLPAERYERAVERLQLPDDDFSRMDRLTFTSKLHDLLELVEAGFREEPLVVSVLDGSTIKTLLEDEDDFAMLAENLFTELDVDDSGKLSRKELRFALMQMGVEMGVPNPSATPDADALLYSILKKHEVDSSEELGQAQFAKELQGILQELADSLASKPIVVILDVKVNNGHQLRKVLADCQLLSDITNDIFQELDINKDGKLNKSELCSIFESRGSQWGLPSKDENNISVQLYDEVFSILDTDNSGTLDKDEFQVLVKGIFESFASQLELNPVFLTL
eukprot:c17856_g2_i1 orf=85-1095(+)